MTNYALVIGCDRYWSERADLFGAVRDALAMRAWLLHPAKGNVPRQNLTLLLTPARHSVVPPSLASVPHATRGNIVQAIGAMLARADGDNGTLYFYFAGHGLTALADGFEEPCLLPTDFLPGYRDPALPIRDVREQFATSSLAKQFFFIDACRAAPVDRAFRATGISVRRPRNYGLSEPDQYVRFATSAGEGAYETEAASGKDGAFTAALMRGLAGAGSAKRWDSHNEQYVVRMHELSSFVRAELVARGVPQVPRNLDQYLEPNPVLVRFPEHAFPKVALRLAMSPPEAATVATVGALGPGDRISRPPLPNPLMLELAPRTYSVRAYAPSFIPRRAAWVVDLYSDTEVEIEFEPGASDESPAWAVGTPLPGFERCSYTDSPTIVVADRSAVIEGVDEAGAARYAAGTMGFDRSGRYRLRVVEPHGAGPAQVVEVAPDGRREVALAAAPAFSALAVRLAEATGIRTGESWWSRDGWRLAPLPAGAVGGLAALMALATDAAGSRAAVFDLGIAPLATELTAGRSGVLVVVVGAGSAMTTAPVHGDSGETVVLQPCHDQTSAAALLLSAGPAVVTVNGLFPTELRIATHIPADNPALVMVDVSAEGAPVVLSYPVARGADLLAAQTALLRADRAQRFAAQGRNTEALAVLRAGPAGHVGDVLYCLLAARSGAARVDQVDQTVAELRRRASGLPDLAVLNALVRAYGRLWRSGTRVRPFQLSAVPVAAAALRTAAQLFHDSGVDLPALVAEAAAGLIPGQPVSAWFRNERGVGGYGRCSP